MLEKSRGACLAAVLALAYADAPAATPTETLAAFHQALAGGDRDKVLALLAPQVVIYESGQVERSRDEYAAYHLGADIAYAKTVTRKVLASSERIDGNTAVVWEESEATNVPGKAGRVHGLDTAVLEKKGDGWVIVHVHWSSHKTR
jgi:hypothetical protein